MVDADLEMAFPTAMVVCECIDIMLEHVVSFPGMISVASSTSMKIAPTREYLSSPPYHIL